MNPDLYHVYVFVVDDAPVLPILSSARFRKELGKPTPREQAFVHALELTVSERSRITILDEHGKKVTTIGRRR
jgi:hypothetical protein